LAGLAVARPISITGAIQVVQDLAWRAELRDACQSRARRVCDVCSKPTTRGLWFSRRLASVTSAV
jgi:hypothetical protein